MYLVQVHAKAFKMLGVRRHQSLVAKTLYRGVTIKYLGVWDFGWVCIEFAPIFIQFRFFNGKKFVWGFEPVSPLPKHTHDSIIISI